MKDDGDGREYRLVCEGACNPGIAELDATIRRERAGSGVYGPGSLTAKTLDRVTALRHTPHARVADGVCACLDCGTTRRY